MTELRTAVLDQLAERVKNSGALPTLIVPIDNVVPNPDQPRRVFTDEATPEERKAALEDIAGLAMNISARGLLIPILVRAGDAPGHYMIVDGERRWRAFKHLGRDTIPVMPAQPGSSDDPLDLLINSLSANEQRSDLTLRETAAVVLKVRDAQGKTDTDVAAALGWSKSKISKFLALGRLTGLALDAFDEGLLRSPDTIAIYAKLPPKAQQRLLAEARRTRNEISRGEAQRAMNAAKRGARTASSDLYTFPPLQRAQAAALFAALGAELPEPPAARTQLRELLNARVTNPSA